MASCVMDVLEQSGLDKHARIVEFNKAEEPVSFELHNQGLDNLYVVNDNPDIYNSPCYTKIRYCFSPTSESHFPSSFFDAVLCSNLTDVRVISDHSLDHFSRILKSKGLLILSPPEGKRSERRKEPQLVPSTLENVNFTERVSQHGFDILAKENLSTITTQPNETHPNHHASDSYSVVVALRKKNRFESARPQQLSILRYTANRGGISEYINSLSNRLRTELAMDVQVVDDPLNVKYDLVLVEYESGLGRARGLLSDVETLRNRGKTIIIEIHDWLTRSSAMDKAEVRKLENETVLTYRANEVAQKDGVESYYLCPHISYLDVPATPFAEKDELCLGTFGFSTRGKRLHKIVALAKSLNIRTKILASINEEYGREECLKVIKELKRDPSVEVLNSSEEHFSGKSLITVKTGFFTTGEIAKELEECSHIVFAPKTHYWAAGTMTFAKRLSKPIVALDSFQARQAQVIRVDCFVRTQELKESLSELWNSVVHFRGLALRIRLGQVMVALTGRTVTRSFLIKCSKELSRDEDGMEYLESIMQEIHNRRSGD